MILVSKTYSETTPESAEDGEHSDSGFVFKACEYGFRELVAELKKGGYYASSTGRVSRETDPTHYWVSTYPECIDYATGTEREESLHYCRENNPRSARYWFLALKAAGVIQCKGGIK